MPYDTRRNRFLTVAAVAVTALAGFGASVDRAEAAFSWTDCGNITPPDASDELTPNIGCAADQNNETRNPSAAAGDYNGLFGQSGWVEIVKDESVNDPVDFSYTDPNDPTKSFSFTGDGDNFSGDWSVGQGFRNMYAYLAIVLKDGGNKDPSTSIAYLIGDVLSGSWTTPWVNSGTCTSDDYIGCTRQDSLSNLQLIGINVVPLPASALLLLGGIGGLGALRAARRKA